MVRGDNKTCTDVTDSSLEISRLSLQRKGLLRPTRRLDRVSTAAASLADCRRADRDSADRRHNEK